MVLHKLARVHGDIPALETCLFDLGVVCCDSVSGGFNAEAIAFVAVTTAPVRVDWVCDFYASTSKATAIKLYVSGHRPHQFWEVPRKIIIILRMRNCAIAQR